MEEVRQLALNCTIKSSSKPGNTGSAQIRLRNEKDKAMPKKLIGLIFARILSVGSGLAAEVFVSIAPPRVVVEKRGRAPGRDHVWINSYHRWDRKAYHWEPGRWERPPRPNARWEQHRWVHREAVMSLLKDTGVRTPVKPRLSAEPLSNDILVRLGLDNGSKPRRKFSKLKKTQESQDRRPQSSNRQSKITMKLVK